MLLSLYVSVCSVIRCSWSHETLANSRQHATTFCMLDQIKLLDAINIEYDCFEN